MAKQKKKTEKEEIEEKIPKTDNNIEEQEEMETYNLVELVSACPVDDIWIIYNLARTGLLPQYEYELQNYGVKNIPTTLTIQDFDKIVNGEQ